MVDRQRSIEDIAGGRLLGRRVAHGGFPRIMSP
jgi:hypothetical protein